MITATETRKRARESLKGKWGKAALITLCFALVEWLIGFVVGLAENEDALSFILSIANVIITVPITFGIWYSFMKLKRDEDVGVFDFLKLGFSNFKRSWKISLNILRKLILPIICTFVASIILIIGCIATGVSIFNSATNVVNNNYSNYNNYYNYDIDDDIDDDISSILAKNNISSDTNFSLGALGGFGIAFIVIGFVALMISYVYTFIKSLNYVLANFIAIDNPDLEEKAAVEKSKELMTGNRGNYFVLTLSFIGWAILAVFTLCIGFLWLLPYIYVAQICFYEHLAGKYKDTAEVEAEVINEN